jgi:hypothetical protein
MAIDAEQLNIILTAQTAEMRRELDRAQRRISGFEGRARRDLNATTSHFDTLARGAKILGPILAATFSVQAFQGALQAAVDIENLSNIAGVATDKFQVLALTSQQFGINQEKLSDILKDVNDKFGDYAQTGAGPLADFFTNIAPKVGLTAAAFANLSSDQKLGAYINALESANVSQADMTFYMEAIASDSTALVRAFTNNSQAILEMERKAADLGLVLDSEMIAKAREAKQELDLMAKVMDINVTNALIALGPLAIKLTSQFEKLAEVLGMAYQGWNLFMNIGSDAQLNNAMNDLDDQIGKVTLAFDALNKVRSEMESGEIGGFFADERLEEATENYEKALEAMNATTEAVNDLKAAMDKPVDPMPPIPEITKTEDIDAIAAPIERAGTAAKSTAASVAEVNEKLAEMSPLLLQLGFDAEKLQSVANIVESSMENAFMGIVDGTMTAKDAFRSMAAEILKELFRVLVVQRLVGQFKGGGGGILGAIADASGMASGGTLQAGQPAVVGEHGRELFVPSSAGRVLSVPQSKAAVSGGGGGVVINQTINVSTGVQQTVRAEIKSLMPQIADSAKAAVFDAQRRSVNGMGFA